ncbi:DinB family protein [Terrimonas pollutisoli]|uniref:DinB family protein n=1 Tax=Terrimonas pollutisoli TaxID=3034147 RepID=UPI0023EC499C|nr:DinB family protein [Terrimonas sp. H1YJ31]
MPWLNTLRFAPGDHNSVLLSAYFRKCKNISIKQELRPADLQNIKTNSAGHNEKPLDVLLHSFREARHQTIAMLESLDEASIFKTALHPRLKTPMRTMDHFLFVADHDDHHLAKITELIKLISRQR